ncbi:MAG: aldo/keto reductase [Herpetosiphonaceae bacterium]|nr:aldo/keto reductase [Herpetosiphonaceae bacterium]
MEYGTLRGIDKPISRLVQGTIMVNSNEAERSFALLDEILELGCMTFDTGHVYGSGDNERTVGRWVRERGIRDKVVIIGKGAHHNADRQRVTPFDITADLHDSLARFQFEQIDLYLLHRDNPAVAVGPIIETLNEHLRAGKIGAFGASNWSVARIREANDYAQAHGLTPFTASSPNYSLADQVKPPWENCVSISGPQGKAEREWYTANQMPLFTWSSLAGGFFSGRFKRDNLAEMTSYFDKLCVESYCSEQNFERLDRAQALAEEKQLTLPQIALAFILNQPLNIFALVGCHTAAEFKANLEASTVKLAPQELAWLDGERESRTHA